MQVEATSRELDWLSKTITDYLNAKQKIKVHDQLGDGPHWGKSISLKFHVLHIKMFFHFKAMYPG